MHFTRRKTLLGLAAVGLSGCSASAGRQTTTSRGVSVDMQPVPNSGYDAWVRGFRTRAANQGISSNVLNSAFRRAGYLPGVIERDRNQTEFNRTLEDYLSIAASDERVSKGRAAFAQHRATLDAIEQRYDVPGEIVTAIWGLESFYGERRGDISVVSSTSTLAFDGRRGTFFEKQLIAALKILQTGDTTPSNLVGSWAGAMGHTQFIPTSYQAFAVDFTGDGRRDIWSDDPTDSLASTASYLARNGWVRNVKWGAEQGVTSLDGTLIEPQPGGPKFIVTQNFRVIKRYNNSDSYAIGVGHLADRIAGGGPIRASFPPDQYGLSKNDRIQMQQRLTALGFDTGGADGVIGPNTNKAISQYQSSIGLPATGQPSVDLLRRLG